MKLRNIDKMNYYNDSTRTLFESIANIYVLEALKDIVNEDFILIGGLAVSYYSKPYMSSDIDILVRNKNEYKGFRKHKNGTLIDIYDLNDIGLKPELFNEIKDSCLLVDGIKIINPTYLMCILIKNFNYYNRFRMASLLESMSVDSKLIIKKISENDIKNYNNFLIYTTKDYNMKFFKRYNKFINKTIFEGKSGYIEVDKAFDDWIRNSKDKNQILIGGMAMVDYNSKRSTMDSDFIFLSEEDIPTYVYKFKKSREHAFKHIETHVEIETLSPSFLKVKQELIDLIFETSYDKGDYKIASPSGLVVLKLDRLSETDKLDISFLCDNYDIDLEPFLPFLSDKAKENYEKLKEDFDI
jgi:hypothetical protein